ncbi:MarR family transcriptional regulator [Leptospira ryugenii]|uniref:MarR family transcriptional regulator n=1 Tax=Leptospira ryugenii TaxID=1917863 RepID=UPI000D59C65E
MESKFTFDQSYGKVLGQTYMSIFERLSKLMKDANLPITPDQFRVLTRLWQNDGCPQQELANSSNRDRANVTRILDILEREGIVTRKNQRRTKRLDFGGWISSIRSTRVRLVINGI